jgi:cytochrome c553
MPMKTHNRALWCWTVLVLGAAGAAALAAQPEYRAAMARTPDLQRGRELFATCAACHNADGSGAADGSVPAIAGQYRDVIVKQLTDFRADQRWNVRMEKVLYQRHLTEPADFADLAAYASQLPRRATRNVGDGTALRAGTSVYFRSCSGCHGALGEGSASRLTPRLGGQHYGYLLRQIRFAGDRRRPNMAAAHEQGVRKLSMDDIRGVADYLSRLDPGAVRTPPY